MTAYQILITIILVPVVGYAAGRLVNHLMHANRQKEAIARILWQEAAERAQLTADVRRIAVAMENIALYLRGCL